jgi:hypothetical protein
VEGNLTVIDGLDTAVADGDAKQIASQLFEQLAAGACRLAMHHPVFLPHICRRLLEQAGLVESGTHFSAKDLR